MSNEEEMSDLSREGEVFTEEDILSILVELGGTDGYYDLAPPKTPRPPKQFEEIAYNLRRKELSVRLYASENLREQAKDRKIDLMRRCHGQGFTTDEIELIVHLVNSGVPQKEVAERLLRPSSAVRQKTSVRRKEVKDLVTQQVFRRWTEKEEHLIMQAIHPSHPPKPLAKKDFAKIGLDRTPNAIEVRITQAQLRHRDLMAPERYAELCAVVDQLKAQDKRPEEQREEEQRAIDALEEEVMSVIEYMSPSPEVMEDENEEADPRPLASQRGGKGKADRRSDSPAPDVGSSSAKRYRTPPPGRSGASGSMGSAQGGSRAGPSGSRVRGA